MQQILFLTILTILAGLCQPLGFQYNTPFQKGLIVVKMEKKYEDNILRYLLAEVLHYNYPYASVRTRQSISKGASSELNIKIHAGAKLRIPDSLPLSYYAVLYQLPSPTHPTKERKSVRLLRARQREYKLFIQSFVKLVNKITRSLLKRKNK